MEKQDSPPKSLIHRASAKAARASASALGSVLGGISKFNPIPQRISDAEKILVQRENAQLDQLHEINAKNMRLSRWRNKYTGPMFGQFLSEKRQQEIREYYETAIDILKTKKRFKILALTNSPTDLADYAEEQASRKHYIGGKKKGKSRKSSKSSKTRKNRKTRSRK
jgi:hypothetical protein